MGLSAAARRTIGAFAAQLNLTTEPAADGSHAFAFERSGTLSFTAGSDERVLISLAWRPALLDEEGERSLLSLAGPDPSDGAFLHAGIAAGGVAVLAMSVDEADFDLPRIDACLQRLTSTRSAFA